MTQEYIKKYIDTILYESTGHEKYLNWPLGNELHWLSKQINDIIYVEYFDATISLDRGLIRGTIIDIIRKYLGTNDFGIIFEYYEDIKEYPGDWFDIYENTILLMEHHVNKTTLDVDVYEEKLNQIIGTLKFLNL
jgi:hypothetical protein